MCGNFNYDREDDLTDGPTGSPLDPGSYAAIYSEGACLVNADYATGSNVKVRIVLFMIISTIHV